MATYVFSKKTELALSSAKAELEKLKAEIVPILPAHLRRILDNLMPWQVKQLEEIRLREGRPLMLRLGSAEMWLKAEGIPAETVGEAYHVTKEDLQRALQLLSQSSIYALEEEMRNGYITIPGGHRVGFVGEAVLEQGKVKTLKNISSLNIRLAREVVGCADSVMPYLYDPKSGKPYHTLIISPPRCGKTTLLRDIVRQFSEGIAGAFHLAFNVGLVDERSEIAGCYLGRPQKNVGPRTDVLDGCPKAQGMVMLVRSMSPQIVATDEIGRLEDVAALEEMLNAGVAVITTVHGNNLNDLERRPILKNLITQDFFERYVLLGRTYGVGTIEAVLDARTKENLLAKPIPGNLKEGVAC
jgi:stage III sporulation protein AA